MSKFSLPQAVRNVYARMLPEGLQGVQIIVENVEQDIIPELVLYQARLAREGNDHRRLIAYWADDWRVTYHYPLHGTDMAMRFMSSKSNYFDIVLCGVGAFCDIEKLRSQQKPEWENIAALENAHCVSLTKPLCESIFTPTKNMPIEARGESALRFVAMMAHNNASYRLIKTRTEFEKATRKKLDLAPMKFNFDGRTISANGYYIFDNAPEIAHRFAFKMDRSQFELVVE